MKHEARTIAAVAAMLYATGCTQSMTSNSLQTDSMSVSVQFVIPSEQQRLAYGNHQTDAQLAADSPYSGFSQQQGTNMPQDWSPHVQHVALWGGAHNGTDVTMHPTALPPGSYTFAFFDQPNEAVMQGWMDVQNTGNDLVGILSNWKDTLSQQKQRLAYDFEIDGRTQANDPEIFKNFKQQITAYDQLERQVQKALHAELKYQATHKNQIADLLSHSDIVIMPGDESFFRPTTESTFTESELDTVRNGNAMTKLVMAADYENAQWKLQHVQQLYSDLSRFKEVLKQEADRLERQKGLFLLTDHLYHHDKRFVENEMRLQNTLGMIDRCEQRATELRERRLGLAFVTALFAPDASLEAFDTEEKALRGERIVLNMELGRLDAIANATSQDSVKRVAIERKRQNVMTMVDSLDNQMEQVDQARMTMMAMAASTKVIHRHNDMRLLTTTLVSDDVPYTLLQNIKRQAMLTVRLEMTDKIYVPRPNPVTTASLQQTAPSTYEPSTPPINQTSSAFAPASDNSYDRTQATTSAKPQFTPNQPSHQVRHHPASPPAQPVTQQHVSQPRQEFAQQPASHPVDRATQQNMSKPVQQPVEQVTQQFTQKKPSQPVKYAIHPHASKSTVQNTQPMKRFAQKPRQHTAPKTVQQPMQPSQHPTMKKQSPKHAQATPKRASTRTSTSLVSQANPPSAQTNSNQDCPWYVKLLVPPCWITSMDNQGQVAKTKPVTRKTTLTGQKARPSKMQNNTNEDCHWLVKLFAPPCWMSKSQNDQTVTQQPKKLGTMLTGHSHNKNGSDDKECTCWLAKLFVPSCWFYNSHNAGQVAKTIPQDKKSVTLTSQSNDADDNVCEECSCWLAKIFVPSCWCHDAIKKHLASLNGNQNSKTRLTSHKSPSANAQTNSECHWLAKLFVPPCWFSNTNNNSN